LLLLLEPLGGVLSGLSLWAYAMVCLLMVYTHSPLGHSVTRSVTRSLTQSITHSLAHSVSRSVTHSLIRSLVRSLDHSLTMPA